jgi:membrane associated rhomboid family serine protease
MMIGFALAQLVLDHFVPRIAAFAHMGGLVAGIALGFVTSTRTPSKEAIDGTQTFVGG